MLQQKQLQKLSLCVFLGVFVGSVFCYSPMAMGQTDTHQDEMEIVFFNPDSTSQNPIDATNALQTFCNVLNMRLGWNLKAHYFKKQKDLEKFLDERDVDLGILSQIFVVENYKKRNFVPFCIPVRNGKTTYRKVIIVRKDKGYRDLQDLKGKKLAATALGDENIPFYNKVVFRGEIDVQTHFNEIKVVDSTNSAILAVLYGEVDAAAVTMASFVIMQDLRPQVKKELSSIFTSAETPISPMVYFKDNLDPAKISKLDNILLNMHNDLVGRQSMLAFQVEAWESSSLEDFRETERIVRSSSPRPLASTAKPVPTPKAVAVPGVTLPVISRIQSYPSNDGKQLLFNVRVEQVKPGIDRTGTTLTYRIDNGSQQQIRMEFYGKNKFQAAVDLPEKDSTEGKEIIHVVKPGDTLGKLAARYLGSSKKYNVIATYNSIKNPNMILINQKLRIKTGETKVTEVTYFITARDKEGQEVRSNKKSKFVL